jgi:phosphate-selective porin OprO/OprP
MKDQSISLLSAFLLIALMLWILAPQAAQAQDLESRVKTLEAQLKSLKATGPRSEVGPTDFRAYWKEGLRLDSGDGNFKMKIGGRIMFDSTWVSEETDIKNDLVPTGGSALGDQEDGVEFRRVRLYTSGLVYGNVEFKLQFDFAGSDADLKDAYLGLTDFPLGGLRAGHFKEPFGLEELTSSKYITFMERALPIEAFSPSRNAGVMLFDTAYDERMTWAAGIFRETDDFGEGQDDEAYSFTGRITGLPWYDPEGASLLHIGAAVSSRNADAETEQYRSRPEAHLLDRFVDTNSIASDHTDIVGLEAAWVKGSLSIQGEYIFANANQRGSSPDLNYDGYYVQGSYFLTGEHRNYKPSAGAFSRVKPNENFGGGGPGAWEVALRYSQLDLDDGGVDGGELTNITAGLNWHLNPNTRLMWNYIQVDKDSVGDADILMMRLQIDF